MSHTTLHLFKENFKFSSAHFLIFDAQRAEKLHGHNYRVRVQLEARPGAETGPEGYFIDFHEVKSVVKAQMDLWDEHVLFPEKHPEIKISRRADGVTEVRFRERYYAFPSNEVIALPITNTSVEQLSKLLAEIFYQKFQARGVARVSVFVEETPGQGAETHAP